MIYPSQDQYLLPMFIVTIYTSFSIGLKQSLLMSEFILITLHSMDPKLVRMTVGCGISHTITKTHIQYN
jgi:hypothetical protein